MALLSGLRAPGTMLAVLDRRMDELAGQERYEEAALVRDRLRSLAAALERDRRDGWLVRAGAFELETDDGVRLRFEHGALTRAGEGCARQEDPLSLPCPRERADELAAVRGWLARHRVRVIAVDGHRSVGARRRRRGHRAGPLAGARGRARAARRARPRHRGDRARRLDWRAWTPPSSSREPARPSGSSSVRSPRPPPSSSARWPPSRRSAAPSVEADGRRSDDLRPRAPGRERPEHRTPGEHPRRRARRRSAPTT